MAFLTVAGITVPVAVPGATERTARMRGEAVVMFDNSIINTEDPATRRGEWEFTTRPITSAEASALIGAADGRVVTCSGDFAGGASLSCHVRVTAATYRKVAPGVQSRVLTLLIRQA